MSQEYLRVLRCRLAHTAIGPSTARKMGPAGTIAKARTFLQQIPLNDFVVNDEGAFRAQLDGTTLEMTRRTGVNGVFHYHIPLPLSPFLSLSQLLFLFPFIDITLILRIK